MVTPWHGPKRPRFFNSRQWCSWSWTVRCQFGHGGSRPVESVYEVVFWRYQKYGAMKQMYKPLQTHLMRKGCFGLISLTTPIAAKRFWTWPNGSILLRHAIYVPILPVCIAVFTMTLNTLHLGKFPSHNHKEVYLCVSRLNKAHTKSININTKTSPVSVFIGMISSKNAKWSNAKHFKPSAFLLRRPWNPNASKKAAFPRRNRCLLWDSYATNCKKHVFSNMKLTNTLNCFATIGSIASITFGSVFLCA